MAAKSSKTEYQAQAGDIIWLDFDPRVGREQSGRRPAIIVSPAELYQNTRLLIVCPITTKIRPFPSGVILPESLSIKGEILTSHVRSIDALARPIKFSGERLPQPELEELRSKLAALLGIDQEDL